MEKQNVKSADKCREYRKAQDIAQRLQEAIKNLQQSRLPVPPSKEGLASLEQPLSGQTSQALASLPC